MILSGTAMNNKLIEQVISFLADIFLGQNYIPTTMISNIFNISRMSDQVSHSHTQLRNKGGINARRRKCIEVLGLLQKSPVRANLFTYFGLRL
jgi:hypothetical protein